MRTHTGEGPGVFQNKSREKAYLCLHESETLEENRLGARNSLEGEEFFSLEEFFYDCTVWGIIPLEQRLSQEGLCQIEEPQQRMYFPSMEQSQQVGEGEISGIDFSCLVAQALEGVPTDEQMSCDVWSEFYRSVFEDLQNGNVPLSW